MSTNHCDLATTSPCQTRPLRPPTPRQLLRPRSRSQNSKRISRPRHLPRRNLLRRHWRQSPHLAQPLPARLIPPTRRAISLHLRAPPSPQLYRPSPSKYLTAIRLPRVGVIILCSRITRTASPPIRTAGWHAVLSDATGTGARTNTHSTRSHSTITRRTCPS